MIGAITPTTNPTATIINNTIAGISAGNAIVFNVHPNAKGVSVHAIRLINRAITDAGGPADLVTGVPGRPNPARHRRPRSRRGGAQNLEAGDPRRTRQPAGGGRRDR